MIPEEIYKRRHNSTPWFVTVVIANYIVFAVLLSFYHGAKLNWFFWVALAVLIYYNFVEIRRNREQINKTILIVYIVNLLIIAIGWVIFYMIGR